MKPACALTEIVCTCAGFGSSRSRRHGGVRFSDCRAPTRGGRASRRLAGPRRERGRDAPSSYAWTRRLRFALPLVDLSEALAIRIATERACRQARPRALIYMTSIATLFEPRSRLGRAGIRYDALARENRPGWRGLLQRPLRAAGPRRRQGPGAARARHHRRPRGPGRDVAPDPGGDRERRAPRAKLGRRPSRRQPGEEGARHDGRGLGSGQAVGCAPPRRRHRPRAGRALPRSARSRRPRFGHLARESGGTDFGEQVATASAYLAASRFEDFGIAQLQALAAGTPLVTTPSAGPFEALRLARELSPVLVAEDRSATALAVALRSALDWDDAERDDFSLAARAQLKAYSPEAMRQRLAEILALLLDRPSIGGPPAREVAAD